MDARMKPQLAHKVRQTVAAEDALELADIAELGESWMQLARKSHDLFRDVQIDDALKAPFSEQALQNNILKHSQKYLSTLEEIQRALYDALDHGHLPPNTMQKMEEEFHTFTNLVHLWRLCQIVFLEFTEDFDKPYSEQYAIRLVQFRNSLSNAPLRTMPETESITGSEVDTWIVIKRFVLLGQLNEASEVLPYLSNRTQQSFAVTRLKILLEGAPVFSDPSAFDEIITWREGIEESLSEEEIQNNRTVSEILRLLLGDFRAWSLCGPEFSSWLSFFISRLMYASGPVSPTGLASDLKQISEAIGACQTDAFSPELTMLFESILRVEWDDLFETMRKYHKNTWFSTHIWDLIHRTKSLIKIGKVEGEMSAEWRDLQIVEYASTAIGYGHWLPFIRYFQFCSEEAQGKLVEVMNANDFSSVQQRNEVIAALESDGMTVALREVYKRDAASFAQKGDYAEALKAAHLTDETFLTQIGDRYVEYIRRERGSVGFTNADMPVLTLLPDQICRRLGYPGFMALYEKAVKENDIEKALNSVLLLLKRASKREEIYKLVDMLNKVIEGYRMGKEDFHVDVYKQLRTWLVNLPYTNWKPRTDPEKALVAKLEKEICPITAWSLDHMSAYAQLRCEP
ncbi:hypothetical protein RvY_00563 [Ramazzottius varieornatus]|uniref:Nuclear pore complex protein Nup85 n=1 Tax=Ramazzottius varieornatus TaxID=947166 RepID=A0A1D1UJH6_RAMVA|nr:hypothetical protein RvY_00563 [Ramazzottius varieornatus]